MRAIDTNVFVRLVTRDDPKQVAAAESFAARGGWISHLVLAEATWVLMSIYGLDSDAIAAAIEMLLNHQTLTVQDPETVGRALEHYRDNPAIGFSDCLILELARKAGHLPLGTFDRALSKLSGTQKL
jgi:predicted nucleic-acid-binding protein